jgi:hypothetical protein
VYDRAARRRAAGSEAGRRRGHSSAKERIVRRLATALTPITTIRGARRAAFAATIAAGLLTGCIGLWRGDYYAGRSSGGLDACVPFNFDVSIEEAGRIMGLAATTYPWGTASWDVTGQVTGLDIVLETRAQDPRVSQPVVRWRGKRHAISLEVTEEQAAAGCPAPRTATLNRK